MDYVFFSGLALVFGLLPLYFRSNSITVLGMLAYGWVINDMAGAKLLREGASLMPGMGDMHRALLMLVVFGPAILAILLTKGKVKAPPKLVLSIGIAPAAVVIGWRLLLATLPLDQARSLASGELNREVIRNQEYALWLAVFMLAMLLFMGKKKKPVEGKPKKK